MLRKKFMLLLVLLLFLPWHSAFAQYPAMVKQYAGTNIEGYKDENAAKAQFRSPAYVAVDAEGNIYVSDSKNHLIRKIDKDGQVTTVAGKLTEIDAYGHYSGGFADGEVKNAMFNEPQGIAVAKNSVIYVADSKNGAIRKIENGTVSTIVRGLKLPTGLVIGNQGELYVSETLNHRIIKITNEKDVTVVAGSTNSGLRDGTGTNARFNEPTGLAIGKNGTLYVADSANQRIRSVTTQGIVKTIAGSGSERLEGTNYFVGGYVDGKGQQAKFNFPQGIEVADDGTIYVADTLNHVIRKISPSGEVTTVAGNGEPGNINQVEVKASFDRPTDVFVLPSGDLGVVDHWNHSLRIIEWYKLPDAAKKLKEVHVIWNNQIVQFDVKPMIKNGRTMVPIRKLAENFGYRVDWDQKTKTVTLTYENKKIVLKIGSMEITGDVKMKMDIAPFIVNGRTLVPIRFVSEAFNKDVKWLPETKTVLIRD